MAPPPQPTPNADVRVTGGVSDQSVARTNRSKSAAAHRP